MKTDQLRPVLWVGPTPPTPAEIESTANQGYRFVGVSDGIKLFHWTLRQNPVGLRKRLWPRLFKLLVSTGAEGMMQALPPLRGEQN